MPFSTRWFLVYYIILGLLLTLSGSYLVIKNDTIKYWLNKAADTEKPPVLLIRILKYITLFTLPGLVLAFFPFSWIELVFCFWSLLLLYIAGAELVRWEQSRLLIKRSQQSLSEIIRKSGAIMLSVGFAIFLLAYLVVKRTIE
ncbi:hypothetical protein SAMN05443144_104220 [Fodinibius roseus]|uniref:DUF2269 family protein n=1 Tax=Fodinibius roseus TaxID=1194090 RepID=A0A1M4XUF1_9BACT|nr:hypothetical protein [Fodinibius roseus]SHE97065.1 hypothetical protein SAMN05443144_104220 [Fodinibius roseus]